MTFIETLEKDMDELLDAPEIRDYLACQDSEDDKLALLSLGMEMRIKFNSTPVSMIAAYALLQRLKQQQCRDERTVTA